jgi:hypothetical protein
MDLTCRPYGLLAELTLSLPIALPLLLESGSVGKAVRTRYAGMEEDHSRGGRIRGVANRFLWG